VSVTSRTVSRCILINRHAIAGVHVIYNRGTPFVVCRMHVNYALLLVIADIVVAIPSYIVVNSCGRCSDMTPRNLCGLTVEMSNLN